MFSFLEVLFQLFLSNKRIENKNILFCLEREQQHEDGKKVAGNDASTVVKPFVKMSICLDALSALCHPPIPMSSPFFFFLVLAFRVTV
jgi:hypothetical protein